MGTNSTKQRENRKSGRGIRERKEGIVVLQHNCTRDKQTLKTLLEITVSMVVDLILIQEPGKGRGSTVHYDRFRWIKGREEDQAKY